MHNPLQDTIEWFNRAVPAPTEKNLSIQIGCFFEEVAEVAKAIGDIQLADYINKAATAYKSLQIEPLIVDDVELLDGLADVNVTGVGIAYMRGYDYIGALNEVNRSNWSKFENGQPVFNEQGKIKKGKDYTPPNLKPFINGSNSEERTIFN